MAWVPVVNYDTALTSGTRLRLLLSMNYVNLPPSNSDIVKRIESTGFVRVADIKVRWWEIPLVTAGWNLEVVTARKASVAELSIAIIGAVDKWNTWNVSVTQWQADLTDPSDLLSGLIPRPTTQTAVTLTAVAVIGLLVVYLLHKGDVI